MNNLRIRIRITKPPFLSQQIAWHRMSGYFFLILNATLTDTGAKIACLQHRGFELSCCFIYRSEPVLFYLIIFQQKSNEKNSSSTLCRIRIGGFIELLLCGNQAYVWRLWWSWLLSRSSSWSLPRRLWRRRSLWPTLQELILSEKH